MEIISGSDTTMEFKVCSSHQIQELTDKLHYFLVINDLHTVRSMVSAIFTELVINSLKAQQKRLFFENQGLDFIADYEHGNLLFKEEISTNPHAFDANIPDEHGTSVRFYSDREYSIIQVTSNIEMHPDEKKTVSEKIRQGTEIEDSTHFFFDSDEELHNPSEGAGFGLVMSIIMLKNVGIPADALSFISQNGQTHFILKLPTRHPEGDVLGRFIEIFESKGVQLPVFAATHKKLQGLPPDARFDTIREILRSDPGIMLHALRKMLKEEPFRPRILERAVTTSGFTQALIDETVAIEDGPGGSKIEAGYQTAVDIADIALSIAPKIIAGGQELLLYAALFHNCGKTILYSLNDPQLHEFIELSGRIFPPRHLHPPDEVSCFGFSHAWLGAGFLGRWNFPYILCDAVRFQNRPDLCPEESRSLAAVLYLAKIIYRKQKKGIAPVPFEKELMLQTSIIDEQGWEMVVDRQS